MLNELISREDCANCRICCKFEEDELIDAPTFTKEQVDYIKKNIDKSIKFTKNGNIYQIKLIKYSSKYKCPLLSDTGCILPNKYRPFDCESWPFYVMKKDNTYVITKSNDCPIFKKIDNKILIKYIEDKFLSLAIEIAKDHPDMVTNYNRDLDILYEFRID